MLSITTQTHENSPIREVPGLTHVDPLLKKNDFHQPTMPEVEMLLEENGVSISDLGNLIEKKSAKISGLAAMLERDEFSASEAARLLKEKAILLTDVGNILTDIGTLLKEKWCLRL